MPLFDYSKVRIHWFPSHMQRGMEEMSRRISKKVDLIIEVRDARIPTSSANPLLESLLPHKRRIVIFNKTDLADPSANRRLHFWSQRAYPGRSLLLTNQERDVYQRLFRMIRRECLETTPQTDHAKPGVERARSRVLVVGVPNVGKSTILNRLRAMGTPYGGHAVKVGDVPGITRALSDMVKICMDPLIYIYDTPGVLMPKIERSEVGLKLALTGAILDQVVGPHLLTDYLLYTLNNFRNEAYIREYGLDGPCTNPLFLLNKISNFRGEIDLRGSPNVNNSAGIFLRAFRSGRFGQFTLDEIGRSSSGSPTDVCSRD